VSVTLRTSCDEVLRRLKAAFVRRMFSRVRRPGRIATWAVISRLPRSRALQPHDAVQDTYATVRIPCLFARAVWIGVIDTAEWFWPAGLVVTNVIVAPAEVPEALLATTRKQ
jgi:hypothetical protein